MIKYTEKRAAKRDMQINGDGFTCQHADVQTNSKTYAQNEAYLLESRNHLLIRGRAVQRLCVASTRGVRETIGERETERQRRSGGGGGGSGV